MPSPKPACRFPGPPSSPRRMPHIRWRYARIMTHSNNPEGCTNVTKTGCTHAIVIDGEMNARYERTGRILYWLVPLFWCLALYWQGLFTWFQADDFAWLNLQVHSWNDLLKALFTPQAQGTVRVWSE